MLTISDEQLISMGYTPKKKYNVKASCDIPDLVCGPYKSIINLLCKNSGPKGFDPLQVQLNANTPVEVSTFISAMTRPHLTRDTPDTVGLFNDIIPRNLDAGSFGRYFDNIIRNIPYKPKSE